METDRFADSEYVQYFLHQRQEQQQQQQQHHQCQCCLGVWVVTERASKDVQRLQTEKVKMAQLPAYGVGKQALIEFHAKRVKAAAAAGLSLVAFETVPDLIEAQAIAEVMNAHAAAAAASATATSAAAASPPAAPPPGIVEGWVTFTCGSADRVDNGQLFSDCVHSSIQRLRLHHWRRHQLHSARVCCSAAKDRSCSKYW